MYTIKETKDEQGRHHSFNDEPAIVYSDGVMTWYHHGKLHRDNEPAELSNGNKYWYRHGKLHRENGPAIVYRDGDMAWFIHGKECAFHEWIKLSPLPDEQKMELLLSHAYN